MCVQIAPPGDRPYDGPMSHSKCRDTDYIDFLIATPRAASCCEAARGGPPARDPPAHDAYTRLLTRLEPDPETLYREVEPMIDKRDGVLVLDDSTLDKLYAKAIEPVHRHWSGKHKSVVRGINLISLVWSDGDRILPADYRIYDKPTDGLTKNDHMNTDFRTAIWNVLVGCAGRDGPMSKGVSPRHGSPTRSFGCGLSIMASRRAVK